MVKHVAGMIANTGEPRSLPDANGLGAPNAFVPGSRTAVWIESPPASDWSHDSSPRPFAAIARRGKSEPVTGVPSG